MAEENIVVERHADDLFKEFKEVSVTEFFRKNKAQLGFSGSVRSLTTVVHELVTNSLDACEEAGILPDIEIEIKVLGDEHYSIHQKDNGPGIPFKHISSVFGKMLAGTKFHRNVQLRGQQGIGVAGVTLFSQMTTGKPIRIKTSTGKKVYELKLMMDVTKNMAEIIETKEYDENWRGTDILCELKSVSFNLGEKGPLEYLRRTAIANPHAKITVKDPEGRKTVFERVSKKIPSLPTEMKPHPKGVDVDELLKRAKSTSARRMNSFLSTEFSRTSTAKAKEIQSLVSFDMNKNPRKLSWAEAEEIVSAFRKIDFMAPPTEGLSPIGEEQIRKAVLSILKPEFEVVLTRNPTTHSSGLAFQVEVAVAYGGGAGRQVTDGTRVEVMRFANRVPLLFDAGGCAITQAVNSVDWKRYDVKDFENTPISIFVNVVSTHIPYISTGKQSIASEDEIVKEIRMALMDAGRKFERYHSSRRRAIEREARLHTLLKYCAELAPAIAKITGSKEQKIAKSLEKIIRKKVKVDAVIAAAEEEAVKDEEEAVKDTTFAEGDENEG